MKCLKIYRSVWIFASIPKAHIFKPSRFVKYIIFEVLFTLNVIWKWIKYISSLTFLILLFQFVLLNVFFFFAGCLVVFWISRLVKFSETTVRKCSLYNIRVIFANNITKAKMTRLGPFPFRGCWFWFFFFNFCSIIDLPIYRKVIISNFTHASDSGERNRFCGHFVFFLRCSTLTFFFFKYCIKHFCQNTKSIHILYINSKKYIKTA